MQSSVQLQADQPPLLQQVTVCIGIINMPTCKGQGEVEGGESNLGVGELHKQARRSREQAHYTLRREILTRPVSSSPDEKRCLHGI